MEQSEPTSWVYINGLGERDIQNVNESDILTAVTYDKKGDYLAVGDRGGRVIVFKYADLKSSRYFDYRYFQEIQAHEPEFDHLKSIEMEEKVNDIEFLHQNKSDSIQLLSTNDRIIKLWSLKHTRSQEFSKCQVVGNQIMFPQKQMQTNNYEGVEKMQFRNCHNYNINSLSVSPDGEYFLSSDDLRIHLWNL